MSDPILICAGLACAISLVTSLVAMSYRWHMARALTAARKWEDLALRSVDLTRRAVTETDKAVAVASAGPSPACPSCRHPRVGRFCARCGKPRGATGVGIAGEVLRRQWLKAQVERNEEAYAQAMFSRWDD